MPFNGASLLFLFILGAIIAISLREFIRHVRAMRRLMAMERKMDLLNSSLDALEADELFGPRPW